MRTVVIHAILVLTLSMIPVAAMAGEKPGWQPAPEFCQPVNDKQLDQFKGRLGDPADLSQVSRTTPMTYRVVDDIVNFSQNVLATMKGYNTHPVSDPSIGPSGQMGPNGHIGPTWLSGKDITIRNR